MINEQFHCGNFSLLLWNRWKLASKFFFLFIYSSIHWNLKRFFLLLRLKSVINITVDVWNANFLNNPIFFCGTDQSSQSVSDYSMKNKAAYGPSKQNLVVVVVNDLKGNYDKSHELTKKVCRVFHYSIEIKQKNCHFYVTFPYSNKSNLHFSPANIVY